MKLRLVYLLNKRWQYCKIAKLDFKFAETNKTEHKFQNNKAVIT